MKKIKYFIVICAVALLGFTANTKAVAQTSLIPETPNSGGLLTVGGYQYGINNSHGGTIAFNTYPYLVSSGVAPFNLERIRFVTPSPNNGRLAYGQVIQMNKYGMSLGIVSSSSSSFTNSITMDATFIKLGKKM